MGHVQGELGTVPPDLILALRSAVDMDGEAEFGNVWSAGAEAGLLWAYHRAGALLLLVSRHLLVGVLCISGDVDLGGRAVGNSGASKLYGVSQENEVDVASAQYFVNSSLAPELLLRREGKSVADVLEGIRQRGFLRADGMRCIGFGVLSVVRSLRAPALLGALGLLQMGA